MGKVIAYLSAFLLIYRNKGGFVMERKQWLLTLWKVLVVALVNWMVYLMLSSGSSFFHS